MYESLWTFPGGVLGEFDRLRRELDDVFGNAALKAQVVTCTPADAAARP